MASETATSAASWGALVFGIRMVLMNPRPLEGPVPVMYGFGFPNGLVGFSTHVGHSTILGVAFWGVYGALEDIWGRTVLFF